eukprot:gb/GECG01016391.1/.p1 GENE.gb/GECG01016391.1/~~gb/GECG01016391.1/.p1  ORF type:complete len:153 (+),score=23.95 gb/GECG01016391.1/:1-459(+)
MTDTTRNHGSTAGGGSTYEDEGDALIQKPYRRQVGKYAQNHGIQRPRPKVNTTTEEERRKQEEQRKQHADFEKPAPLASTAYSHSELKNAFRSNIRHFHDPEDRFEFPMTSNQEVGWGAKKMPPTKYKCPLKSSQLTKVAEKLYQVHGHEKH